MIFFRKFLILLNLDGELIFLFFLFREQLLFAGQKILVQLQFLTQFFFVDIDRIDEYLFQIAEFGSFDLKLLVKFGDRLFIHLVFSGDACDDFRHTHLGDDQNEHKDTDNVCHRIQQRIESAIVFVVTA